MTRIRDMQTTWQILFPIAQKNLIPKLMDDNIFRQSIIDSLLQTDLPRPPVS